MRLRYIAACSDLAVRYHAVSSKGAPEGGIAHHPSADQRPWAAAR
jgi:hypothetical protein